MRFFVFLLFVFSSSSAFAKCGLAWSDGYRNEWFAKNNVIARNVGAGYGNFMLGKYLYYVGGSFFAVHYCDTEQEVPQSYCTGAANACSGTTPGSPNPFFDQESQCHSEGKPYNPALQSCEDACSVGSELNPSANECSFVGCPPEGYIQIGSTCREINFEPPPDHEIICTDAGCFYEPLSCTPSSPDYQGTTNGTHFCNAPPLSCGANQSVGFADLGDGYVRVCVGKDDPNKNNADCSKGYVSINGVCSQPDSDVKEKTTTYTEIGEDGTKKLTETTTTTKNNKDGTTTTTTSTTVKTYDVNNNLIGESTSEGEGEGKEGSSVAGGGSCAIEPTCSGGDAIQCEILKEQWRLRCGGDVEGKKAFDFGDVADQKRIAAQGEYETAISTIKDQIANSLSFDLSSQAGGIPCNVIEIRGVSLDFSWCKFTDYLAWLGLAFIAVAYVRAFQIILG